MHDDENGSKIDFMNRTIVMTCQFAKECANPKSKEYEDLQSVRRDYPTYTVVRRTIKRNPHKESYRGLTYKYIENYIESHCAEKMEEYK